jgi:microsomal dipeptidase-like Zn-dependent dipeptidase
VCQHPDAEAIDPNFELLDVLYAAGLRSLGPVWSRSNAFGHGVPFLCPSSPDTGPGLTDVGKELTRACNRLRILIDLSHLNERGFWDVAAISKAPLVATHSNAHALSPHSRNLTDKQLTAIGETGGMVGVNFATSYLRPGSANVGRRNSFVIRGASTYGFGVKLGRPRATSSATTTRRRTAAGKSQQEDIGP